MKSILLEIQQIGFELQRKYLDQVSFHQQIQANGYLQSIEVTGAEYTLTKIKDWHISENRI